MVGESNRSSKLPLILVVGFAVIVVTVAIVGRPPTELEISQRAEASEWKKNECAKEILEAVTKTRNRDAAEAMLRRSDRGKIVCAGYQMKGVNIIE